MRFAEVIEELEIVFDLEARLVEKAGGGGAAATGGVLEYWSGGVSGRRLRNSNVRLASNAQLGAGNSRRPACERTAHNMSLYLGEASSLSPRSFQTHFVRWPAVRRGEKAGHHLARILHAHVHFASLLFLIRRGHGGI
jgi:hypothetical protein